MPERAAPMLSLWQPWASFMFAGLPARPPKTVETRCWPTPYRGPLLIHATKKEPAWARDPFIDDPELAHLVGLHLRENRSDHFWLEQVLLDLPRGAVLGVVDLIDVVPTGSFDLVSGSELLLGDYSLDRFAWVTANPRRLLEPVPCRGAQGLRTPSPEVTAAVLAALGERAA